MIQTPPFRFLFLLAIAIIGEATATKAQDTILSIPRIRSLDSINSDILKQKRYIEVFTPADYKAGSGQKYDVLYVLDGGNWNTGLVTEVQRFVEGQGYMPPTIIVSVTGIDRNQELTPTHLDSWKNSGGGVKFLSYIKNELIPYINKSYPSNGDNTIWGHSLSAMFVIYALLNEPETFRSYIAADPSVWWDNTLIPKMAVSKLPALAGMNRTLFISGREGPEFGGMKIDTMETILKKYAPASLLWKVQPYTEETHSSVRFKTTYDGLKFTYAGLTSDIQFHPMNGIVSKGKPYKVWYFEDTTRMSYTIDGTQPTLSSPNVRHEISLSGSATVIYKRFTNRSRYDKTVTGNFTTDKIPPPVAIPKNAKPGGFHYAYYEGDWDNWPDLKNIQPVKTGITDKDFDPEKLPRKNNYALLIDGFLEAKQEGYYLFFFQGDKNSKIWLGNKLLMQWDGGYTHPIYSYLVPLSKGFYPLRIEYLCKNKDFKLATAWLTPVTMDTKDPVPFPAETQYSIR